MEAIAAKPPVALDNEGFLLDPDEWDWEVAEWLAERLGLELNEPRREIVAWIREYFETTGTVPELRRLLQHLRAKHGKARATRRYVYDLFPFGYGQQACKIAGMRKPLKLMLDV